MTKTAIHRILCLLLLCFAAISCTEQYAFQTTTFEQALVIEATITNELKPQQIKISRTYKLEENGPTFETGADVYVTDNAGNQYDFEENGGVYTSVNAFQAISGNSYTLHITTSDGKSYSSSAEILTTVNNMQDVTATVQTVNGIRGVSINAKSFDPANSSKYYRYEYEETYKIIAPRWSMYEAHTIPAEPGQDHANIEVVLRGPEETKTCYATEISNDIIQTTTSDLSEDRVDFAVRFISDQNPIISHRYSILVRQYIQSLAAFTFYKTLKELSGSESILSQNQPGFFSGNMHSEENPDEKVVGFFEVASVSSKRIFFNYADLFPGEQLPPYFANCDIHDFKFCFIAADFECKGAALLSVIGTNSLLYFDMIGEYYYMVEPPCGDCTTIGSNVIPPFWED
jgi:hypothetical protein